MECCESKNITCKDCKNVCINCETIHNIIMLMKFLLEIII